jgi:hypothetical protein
VTRFQCVSSFCSSCVNLSLPYTLHPAVMATSPWHHFLPMRLRCRDHVAWDRKLNTLKVLRLRRVLVDCHYRCERGSTWLQLLRRPYSIWRTKDNGKQQSNKIRFRCWGSEEGKMLLSCEEKLCYFVRAYLDLGVSGRAGTILAPNSNMMDRPTSERHAHTNAMSGTTT